MADRKCDIVIQTVAKWRDSQVDAECLRWNPTQQLIEKWTGTAWEAINAADLSRIADVQKTADEALTVANSANERAQDILDAMYIAQQDTILGAELAANEDFTVPTYTVGTDALLVTINGVHAFGGTDSTKFAYTEVGDSSTLSTTIRFFDSYPQGSFIRVRVYHFFNSTVTKADGTVLTVQEQKIAADQVLDAALQCSKDKDAAAASAAASASSATSSADSATASSGSATASANSAVAAKTSETNAKNSETASKTSETNAKNSETAAKTSETNAKNSETASKASETNAKNSETNAKTSETNAKGSETAAKTSETNAKTSETNAKNSEINAKTSETNSLSSANLSQAWAESSTDPTPSDGVTNKSSKTWASESESSATDSASSATASANSAAAAKVSETNAKTSETNAKTSETNAKGSETAAANSAASAATFDQTAYARIVFNSDTERMNAWNNQGFPGTILDFYGSVDANGHPVPCYYDTATSAWIAYGFSLDKWQVCDGTHGTPNLVGKVVVGASTDSANTYKKDASGGAATVTPTITVNNGTQDSSCQAATLSEGQNGYHNHLLYEGYGEGSAGVDALRYQYWASSDLAWKSHLIQPSGSSWNHNHGITNPAHGHTASSSAIDNRMPFVSQYKILRVS